MPQTAPGKTLGPVAALSLTLALALGACGKANNGAPSAGTSAAPAASGAPAADGAQAASAKLNGYTASYNKLIGTFGLTETAESYAKEDIAKQSASDSISITDGWVDQGLAGLKKARAMAGGPADLDQAADKLIGALDKVEARLAPLKIYYDAKSYKDDKLARGKQEDPLMKAEFAQALDALHAFDATLTAERGKQDEAELAALKAKGDLLGYDTKLALKQGERLIGMFGAEKDMRDAATIGRADALVKDMEATLADQRKQYADAKAKAKPGETPDVDYELVANYLTSLAGAYREMKESHDVDDLNQMIKEYNNAIEDANDIG